MQRDADAFNPVFSVLAWESGQAIDGETWAYGFMRGLELRQGEWQPLLDDEKGRRLLRPLYLLGAEKVAPGDEKLTRWPRQRETLAKQIPASVIALYRYWHPEAAGRKPATTAATAVTAATAAPRRAARKTGRNDPCPCGSGKKFKKCCGAGPC